MLNSARCDAMKLYDEQIPGDQRFCDIFNCYTSSKKKTPATLFTANNKLLLLIDLIELFVSYKNQRVRKIETVYRISSYILFVIVEVKVCWHSKKSNAKRETAMLARRAPSADWL